MTRAILVGALLGLTLAGLAALTTKPTAAHLLRCPCGCNQEAGA